VATAVSGKETPLGRLGCSGVLRGSQRNAPVPLFRNVGERGFRATRVRMFSAQKDFYEILGVSRNDDEKTLKRRYRELAKKFHPDSNKEQDATAKFQEITRAYETLSDPEKRRAYDMFGPDYENMSAGGGGGGGEGGGGGFQGFQGFDFSDLFGGAFGEGQGRRRAQVVNTGDDIRVRMNLTFEEAVRGTRRTIPYRADGKCRTCNGNGAKNGETTEMETCKVCNGQGVRLQEIGNFMQIPTACNVCMGTGRRIKNRCSTCNGSGVEENIQTSVEINVPAGVDNGMNMAQPGAGGAGKLGGPPGDLVIEFAVLPDPYYTRQDRNVFTTCNVPLADAVLGGKIGIRTLDGQVDLKIPAGVGSGERRRLRGRGIEDVNRVRGRGDHIVTFKVQMPTSLTDRQKELMNEFDEEEKKKRQRRTKT